MPNDKFCVEIGRYEQSPDICGGDAPVQFGASWSDEYRTVEISCMGSSAAFPEWDGLVTHLFVGPSAVSVVVHLSSGAGWASLSLYEFPDFQTRVDQQ